MGWFEDWVNHALGVPERPQQQVTQQRAELEPRPDHRADSYSSGAGLYHELARREAEREQQATRRTRSVTRQRHYINEKEYIDTETFTEIEEGHIYKEWSD